ncbi:MULTISPECIES: DUF742 domain-containing protein [Streptomyces]|nr:MULTISPECIES: DUF742 domain-containing protein [Streptomyces]MDT9695977.1 DUF742 domain-containing protein [Streptomyces sp. P17]
MTSEDGTPWTVVDALGVRPYAVAGGRTQSRHSSDLQLHTQLEPGTETSPGQVVPEARQIVELCLTRRRSIAELAGRIRQPVPVVQVLVSDLIDIHAVQIAPTVFASDPGTLREVVAALERKWPDARRTAC